MAKMLPCYSLCPLIEQKSFLGLTPDAEQDTVIVTANSNIIGRYKVSDPKQITCWNSKGSISSASVYDKHNETYVGVFNHNELRQWSINVESIDKVKKYKFAEKITGLTIDPDLGKTVVVFEKGYVSYLDTVLEKRKTAFESSRLKEGEKILSYEILSINSTVAVVSLLVSCNNAYRLIGVQPDITGDPLFSYGFQYDGKLLGYCLISDKSLDCITLWSDGQLFRNGLLRDSNKRMKHLNTFSDIDAQYTVALKTLSPYSVALCYVKNGGLTLLVYSVKYNLTHCKQFYENCTNSPQLWYLNSKLFLILGHNLVVVPYQQENRKLSTMVGTNTENLEKRIDEVISEAEICKKTVPQMIEESNIKELRNLVNTSCDIPDSILIDLLLWCLKKKKSRRDVLESILRNFTLTDVSVLKNTVSVDASLDILEYVIGQMKMSHDNGRLVKWATAFIDAYYQQYMMSNDTEVFERLNSYLNVLKTECLKLTDYVEIAATASCITKKKQILS
ncbi:nucleolar protein 11 [Planococcus citri]|uniref:nucleolar protein 11 n=1 Tax=Planococcus citri TaxID=170843 RepID=UPI0031F8F369